MNCLSNPTPNKNSRLFLRHSRQGFTLVELLVSIGIFILMTGLLMAKYGNFNQSVLLTNLAYDVALTIRTAQTYGLSVKGDIQDYSFNYAYGVNFTTSGVTQTDCEGAISNSGQFVLFSDSGSVANSICNDEDNSITSYSLKRGAVISQVCAGTDSANCTLAPGVLDVTFKRPDPTATICYRADQGSLSSCTNTYAKIEVKATDGNTRVVQIRANGQISVLD